MRSIKRLAKNSSKNLALLGISVTVVLLLGELAIRLVLPQQLIVPNPEIWRAADTIGWWHRENANTEINTGEALVHFVSDSNGYRINFNQPALSADKADVAILFIGDSFVEAMQVENNQTFPQLIARDLEKRHQLSFAADNAAVGGWDPNQYLIEARRALDIRRYDCTVVCLYACNDIVGWRADNYTPEAISRRHHFHWPESFSWNGLINAVFYPINDHLETTSHLFIFLKTRMKSVLVKIGLSAAYFPAVFKVSERESNRWQNTLDICRDIANETESYGTPILFVLLPGPFQVNKDQFYNAVESFGLDPDSVDLDQPSRIMDSLFAGAGLNLIDPLEQIRLKADAGMTLYGKIDGHFNPEGHTVTAEIILPIIEMELSNRIEGL